ncbi:MAG: His/Gly/Thr/Pro-type tRNA ligase C-terminal domain-containing protein, partial [Snowella sp.]
PSVGWAIGMERLILLLQQLQAAPQAIPDFYLISKREKAEAQSLILAQKLRQAGFSVELDLSGSAFGKQFKRADRSKAIACLVLGEAEAEAQTIKLKWMASKEEKTLNQGELFSKLGELREQLNRHKLS